MTAPRTAMVLAAGLGSRMRPLTDALPKPLLRLSGKPLLDHALDRLEAAGVDSVVVNAHWQSERVQAHLAGRVCPQVVVRHEAALLDTGGAVAAALDVLGPGPFFVVNGDSFWLDGPTPALHRLAQAWSGDADAVLLVHRSFQVQAETGRGDFAVDPWGAVRRPAEQEIVPYVYAGVHIASAALFHAAPAGRFSLNLLWDRAIAAGRLRAVVHDGLWFHLSTPPDLARAAKGLADGATGETR